MFSQEWSNCNKRVCNMRCVLCYLALILMTFSDSRLSAEESIRRIESANGLSKAVIVTGKELIQSAQFYPTANGREITAETGQAQVSQLFENLTNMLFEAGAGREGLVKLNFYVASPEVRRMAIEELKRWSGGKSLPAVSFVQTRLPYEESLIACDFVAAVAPTNANKPTRGIRDGLRTWEQHADFSQIPTGDIIYVSGQAQRGADLSAATKATLDGLKETLDQLHRTSSDIVQVKCFLNSMDQIEYVTEQIQLFFGDELVPPLSHVEWTSTGLPIEIELVVSSPATDAENSITVITPKGMTHSPVFSRVIWVQSDTHIFLSSVSVDASDGAEREAESVFKEIASVLEQCDSDFRHLVKATYYVSSGEASSALNAIRPKLYDPKRPPAASKAAVHGIGLDVGELSVDLIAIPKK